MKLISDKLRSYLCDEVFTEGSYWDILYDSKNYYNRAVISVFDHWITKNEFQTEYSEQKKKLYREKMITFYLDIYNAGYTLCFGTHGDNISGGKSYILDLEEYLDYITLSLDENLFMSLIVPDLKIIIAGWYGYNLLFFHTDTELKKKFEPIIERNGLHILDKSGMKRMEKMWLNK